jgi:hypothetical protein
LRQLDLYGSYGDALFAKAYEAKLITPIMDLPPIDLGGGLVSDPQKAAQSHYNRIKRSPFKTAVLQMFLLHDKVRLLDAEFTYDYKSLKSTGFVEVVTSIDQPLFVGSNKWDESERQYAAFLKPMVLQELKRKLKGLKLREAVKKIGLTQQTFVSCWFDLVILPNVSKHKEEELSHTLYLLKLLDNKWPFSISIHVIHKAVGSLIALLELSHNRRSLVLQNRYSDVMCMQEANSRISSSISRDMEGYIILKASCESAIGALPKLQTMADVIKLKETRRKDIRRVQLALEEVESSLREGREAAIRQADRLVGIAVKELNKGAVLEPIGRWTTYLSVPAALVLPANPSPGIILGIVGTACTLGSSIAARSQWMTVMR